MTVEVRQKYTKKGNKRISVRVIYVDESRVAFRNRPYDSKSNIITCSIHCFLRKYKIIDNLPFTF